MNLNLIGWIDVYEVACSLRSRLSEFQGTGTRQLPVRGPRKDADPDDEYSFVESKRPLVKRWPELDTVRRKIEDAATQRIGGAVEFGRIFLEMLDPGSHTTLRRDSRPYSNRHLRLVVSVRANPGCWMWCPPEQSLLLPGQVALTSAGLLHAAVNLGDTPRVNLVMDVKAKPRVSADEVREFALREPEEEPA